MAYRKTAKVLAQIEARRQAIIAAAMDVIARDGIEALTTDALRKRADMPVGLIYHYFADLTEVMAAVVQQMAERDLAAIRATVDGIADPVEKLADALAVYYSRLEQPKLIHAIAWRPAYKTALRDEFAPLIRRAVDGLTPKAARLAASAALGAFYGAHDLSEGSRKDAPAVLLMALRAVGVPDRVAERSVEKSREKVG